MILASGFNPFAVAHIRGDLKPHGPCLYILAFDPSERLQAILARLRPGFRHTFGLSSTARHFRPCISQGFEP